MKKIILLSHILLCCNMLIAQKKDTTIAVITYAFSHIRDTTNADHPYTENMNLFLGKHASVYKTGDKKMLDSMIKASYVAGSHTLKIPRALTNEELFFYPETQKFFEMKNIFSEKFLLQSNYPVIVWDIKDETKDIANLHCQKAIGDWGGRTYEAWFCPDLPYHVGPWKLNGLPGLIVEAHDKNNQVIFKFAGYKTVSDNDITIMLPGTPQVTRVEYDRLAEAARKDRAGLVNSMSGGAVKMVRGPTIKEPDNNPIEIIKP